jgi:hypothetical protein
VSAIAKQSAGHATRFATLVMVAAAAAFQTPRALHGQTDTITGTVGCRTPLLVEQLRDGCFDYDLLSRVIPGFADLSQQERPLCTWTVYLTNPVAQASRARKILAPLNYKPSDPAECTQTGIRVRRSRYSWAGLRKFQDRAGEIIDEAGYARQTYALIQDARIVITAHNRRALAKLRTLFRRDPMSGSNILVYGMIGGTEELDRPVTPPRAATLIVLDSLAARYANLNTVAFNDSTLPKGVTARDLLDRGLRLKSPSDARCSKKQIYFLETRQWVDGRIEFTVHEGRSDTIYDVLCTAAGCRTQYPPRPGMGDYFGGC